VNAHLPHNAAVLFATVILSFSTGCIGSLPTPPTTPDANAGFRPMESTPAPGVDADEPRPMALHPGDVVSLRMQAADVETIEGLSVDERGMLHVPLAGDVQVAGLPLVEAEERIEQGMRRFISTVRVTIVMSDPAGHVASVIGAVGEQGRVVIAPGMRVADLLAAAGGPASTSDGGTTTLLADLQSARLVRGGEAMPIDVAIAITGDPRHNVYVRPGDYLYVPPQLRGLISVLGEVNGARVLPFQPGIRLSQALAMAGGITRDANGGDIRIVRGGPDEAMIYRAGIDHVVSGHYADPVLAPGDIVYVGSSGMADFRDFMTAISPILSVGTTGAAIGVTAIVTSGGP